MRVNWSNITVTGISGVTIDMPEIAKVSIFTDNYLTHITDDHFEIKLIARLLNQIYMLYKHLCYHRGMMMHHQVNMNIHNCLLV